MSLPGKPKTAIGVALFYLFLVVVDVPITIARLNIEEWASEHDYDKLHRLVVPPEWLVGVWEFLIGPFGLGFALAALAFGVPNYRSWLFPRKRARDELIELRAVGVAYRNELRRSSTNYNHDAWRKKRRAWSDSVVWR